MQATMHNHSFWLKDTDPGYLKNTLRSWLDRSGLRVIKFVDHHFEPQGYTAMWLLAESHLAIHTFPEQGRSYIELSACNKEKFERFLALAGQPSSVLPFPPIDHLT